MMKNVLVAQCVIYLIETFLSNKDGNRNKIIFNEINAQYSFPHGKPGPFWEGYQRNALLHLRMIISSLGSHNLTSSNKNISNERECKP